MAFGLTKQNLEVDQRVKIGNTKSDLDDATGSILGMASAHSICDFYIVLLDIPIPTHKAITMIETCLEVI